MPGYILHLTEAKLITDRLKALGRDPGDNWCTLFALGNLLPDTRQRTDKVTSHFWDPETMDRLAIAPDMERFERKYGSRVTGPLMLGYWTHLQLDHLYVTEFWNDVMEFRDGEGRTAVRKADITQVYLKTYGTLIPRELFFTREYYYGDYNRMNAPLLQQYDLQIPAYPGSIYCPVEEVDPEDLKMVLGDLERILSRQYEAAKEPLRVFELPTLEKFIADAAGQALPRILADLDRCRLLALDLDGTLLRDDKSLTPAAEKELKRMIDAGNEVVVASGRPIDALPKNIMTIPGLHYALTSNGAAVYDLSTGERICHKPMTAESAVQVLSLLREKHVNGGREESMEDRSEMERGKSGEQGPGTEDRESEEQGAVRERGKSGEQGSGTEDRESEDSRTGAEYAGNVAFEILIAGTPYTSFAFHDDPARYGVSGSGIYYIQTTRIPVPDLYQFAEEHINELDAIDIVTGSMPLKDQFLERLERMPGLYLTHSVAHLIEISNQYAGKGPGLRWLAERLQIPQTQVYAFGNEANDMDMLEYAGCGVAVENSADCVKEIADFVTLSNEEDGVAEFLKQL